MAQINDTDINQMRYHLENLKHGQFICGKQMMSDAVDTVAKNNSYHPVREWVEGLDEWDGIERVKPLFPTYFGSDDTPYNRFAGHILCSGIITRIYEPGAQFDVMIIIEGQQGTGKSTSLKSLSGNAEWFTELVGDLKDKDTVDLIQGVTIVEVAELYTYSKSNKDAAKAFISRTHDKVRLPYKQRAEVFPRQCVFVGTTNQERYLLDDTGNRRFFPIKTGKIDLPALKCDIEQIWAEMLHMHQNNRTKLFVDDPAIADIADKERTMRELYHTQRKRLERFLDDYEADTISTQQLITDVLALDESYFTQKTYKMLANMMANLGWNGPRDIRIGGSTLKGYRRGYCSM